MTAYDLMVNTNQHLINGGELTNKQKQNIAAQLLAARSTPEQAQRFYKGVRYPNNIDGEGRRMYPVFYIPPYNDGKKLKTVVGQTPKTHILSANMYELEILRLLHLFAPENPDVMDMTARTLERLKTTCFAGRGCGLGECFDTALVALRFVITVAPDETAWIVRLLNEYHRNAVEKKLVSYVGRYYALCLSELAESTAAEQDTVGCSSANVYRISSAAKTLYLKTDDKYGELETEYRNLLWLQGKLPVPRIAGWASDDKRNYLLVTEMGGLASFNDAYLKDPPMAVSVLSEGINLLRSLDITDCPIQNKLDRKLTDAAENVRLGRVDMNDWNDDTDFTSPGDLLDYLNTNRPAREDLCFTHGDYCLPNIFGTGNRLSGFIDMGRAGVADIWQDIALCIRSMRYNFQTNAYDGLLLKKLGVSMDEERMRYYILLDELF